MTNHSPPTLTTTYTAMVAGIPVVDLQSGETISSLDRAWREVGFVAIVGHCIDQDLFMTMRSLTKRLFSLKARDKQAYQITSENYRGFVPLGFFNPNRGDISGHKADAYEAFKLHWECPPDHPVRRECALYGGNRWLPMIKDMEKTILAYWSACDSLAQHLLSLSASALGLDHSPQERWFTTPLTNMTLLYYPPQPAGADFGIHPHKDTNVFTLLHPDPVGGLEVLDPDGSWLSVDCPPEALIVNTGEMMEVWSGGRYSATPHRVINQGPDRYSFPYFMVPNHDVVVEPLIPVKPGFSYAPLPVGALSAEVWRTNWPDKTPQTTTFALGSLDN